MMTEEDLIRELETKGYKATYTDGMVIAAVPSYDKDKDKVMKMIKGLGYQRSYGVRPVKGEEEKDADTQKRNSKRKGAKAHTVRNDLP